MANEPNKPATPAPAQQPQGALSQQHLIEMLMAQNKMLVESMSTAISEGITKGITMAEMARTQAQQALVDTSRREMKNLGPPCPKCRVPLTVCGGPEYLQAKDEKGELMFELDTDGKQRLVAGKPVPVMTGTMVKGDDKNHVMLVVMPTSQWARRWFSHRGIHINSVHFQSNNGQHRIPVPRRNDIVGMLQTYSDTEDDNRQGRVRQWDSGHMEQGVRRHIDRPSRSGWGHA